jgi:hypothetical protein
VPPTCLFEDLTMGMPHATRELVRSRRTIMASR